MPRCPTRLPSVVPVGVRSSRALAFLASRWPSGHLTPCVDKNNPNSWISMDFFSSIAYICRSKWCFYDFTVRTRNVSNYQMAAIPKILASKVNKVGKSNMMWSCWSGWNMSHHIFLTEVSWAELVSCALMQVENDIRNTTWFDDEPIRAIKVINNHSAIHRLYSHDFILRLITPLISIPSLSSAGHHHP